MKKINDLGHIDMDSTEGKLLLAAIAKITTESQTDKTPYEVIEQLNKLSNEMLEAVPHPTGILSGIKAIALERQEQLEKHNRTVEYDVQFNDSHQLTHAASLLCMPNPTHTPETDQGPPFEWDEVIWEKMLNKDYKQRLIIAGALIAAEIDRVQADE